MTMYSLTKREKEYLSLQTNEERQVCWERAEAAIKQLTNEERQALNRESTEGIERIRQRVEKIGKEVARHKSIVK